MTVKIHCSILAESALQAAIEDYRKKHPVSVKDDALASYRHQAQEMWSDSCTTGRT